MRQEASFGGLLKIRPALLAVEARRLNAKLNAGYEGRKAFFPGCPDRDPGLAVRRDGARLGWDGNHKAEEMHLWADYLALTMLKSREFGTRHYGLEYEGTLIFSEDGVREEDVHADAPWDHMDDVALHRYSVALPDCPVVTRCRRC